jgi:hypothetical protein
MLRRVLVPGAVTAADVAACQAQPQMNPIVSRLETIFATVGAGSDFLDLIQM